MERYLDDDGTLLLFMEDVADRAGVKPSTIKVYNSVSSTARFKGEWTVSDLPKPHSYVRRKVARKDGRRITVTGPVWREDAINLWLENRRGPGGRTQTPKPTPDPASA